MLRFLSVFVVLVLASCASSPEITEKADPEKEPLALSAARFSDLPGWETDSHADVLAAFKISCTRILKRDADRLFGPDGMGGTYGDWHPACQRVAQEQVTDAKTFFETYFTPHQASYGGKETEGLFTGYYEASLNGSRRQHGPYQYPLRLRPDDLVMVDLGEFRDDLKGRRIAGRVKGGKLKPYESRADIIGGALDDDKLAFVYVDDPVDAFFLHIQGSGRINLDDGTSIRVGYAGQNGHPYYAIGRELIKRGALTKENVSLQSIRAWLEQNPDQASEIMNTNRSYVFMRELDEAGPLGGEGVVLTPERSLAVDRSQVGYGIPVWVDINPPTDGEKRLQRVMIAQDTGGAIRGAVRGDVFWGHGKRAEYLAGQMKSKGRYWFLLPKN